MPGGAGFVGQLGRNRLAANVFAVGAVEIERLLQDQIDHALESRLAADGNLHQHGVATQLGPQLLDDLVGIGADAVHLVDEGQPRHVVAAHLAVDRQRLGLHAADGAEHQHRAVEHAQAPLDLDGEIDVAGRVDQVDRGIAPFDLRGGAGDRDAAFLFQLHVVHGGAAAGAVVDFLHAMDSAGIEQDALAERGLARVDVGRNADVAQLCKVHSLFPGSKCRALYYTPLLGPKQGEGYRDFRTGCRNGLRRAGGGLGTRVADLTVGG